MHGPLSRAERYQKVAAQYLDFAKTAPSPFLRSYYQRTGEEIPIAGRGRTGKETAWRGPSHGGVSSSVDRDLRDGVFGSPPTMTQ
jgi:hypothetical protein